MRPFRGSAPRTTTAPSSVGYGGDRFSSFLARRRGLVLGLVGVATAALAWPMLTIDGQGRASQTPDTEVVQTQQLIDERFAAETHQIPFVIEARDGDVLDPVVLQELLANEQRLRDDPAISDALAEVETDQRSELGILTIADAADALLRASGVDGGIADAGDDAARMATAAIIDTTGPDAWGLAQQATRGPDGTWTSPALFAAVLADNEQLGGGGSAITIGTDDTEREEYARLVQTTLRGSEDTYRAWAIAADVNLTAEEQGRSAGPYIAGAVAAVLVVLGLAFRSYWVVAVAGAGLGGLMIWLIGGTKAIGFEQDQILSTLLPISMISFGIDAVFHSVSRVRESRHPRPLGSFSIGLTAVLGALLLAASTDAAAFLANTVSSIESVRQFGAAAALATVAGLALLGIATPLAVSTIEDSTGSRHLFRWGAKGDLLPILLAAAAATGIVLLLVAVSPEIGVVALAVYVWLAIAIPARGSAGRARTPARPRATDPRRSLVGSLVRGPAAHPLVTLIVTVGITAAAATAATGLETTFDVKDFFSPESDFVVALDTSAEYLGDLAGEPAIVYVEGDFTSPAAVDRLRRFVSDVEADEPGLLARAEDGSLKVAGGALDIIDAAVFAGAGEDSSRSGVRGIFEMALTEGIEPEWTPERAATVLSSEPPGGRYATKIEFELLDTRQQASIQAVRDVVDPMVDALEVDLRSTDNGAYAVLTGSAIVRDEQLDAVAESLLLTVPIAFVACLFIAAAFLRSWKLAFVTALPIGLVVIWLFGFMAAFGFSVNVVTAIIGAISIGIGIDFSAHFVMRYRDERAAAGDELDAVAVAGAGTGAALLGSGITSMAGFAILAFAPMPMFATYGLLTVVMVAMALVAALFVLPSLLTLGARRAVVQTVDPKLLSTIPEQPDLRVEVRAGVVDEPEAEEEFPTEEAPKMIIEPAYVDEPEPVEESPAEEAPTAPVEPVHVDEPAVPDPLAVSAVLEPIEDSGKPASETKPDTEAIIPAALARRLVRASAALPTTPWEPEREVRIELHQNGVVVDDREVPAARSELVLLISPDGNHIDIRLVDPGRTYCSRGASTPHGVVEAMAIAMAARQGIVTPDVLDISLDSVEGRNVLTVVLRHPRGGVRRGSAPIEGSMSRAVHDAVASAFGRTGVESQQPVPAPSA